MVNPYQRLDDVLNAQKEGQEIIVRIKANGKVGAFSSKDCDLHFYPSSTFAVSRANSRELLSDFLERTGPKPENLAFALGSAEIEVAVNGKTIYNGQMRKLGEPTVDPLYFTPEGNTLVLRVEANILQVKGTLVDRLSMQGTKYFIFKSFDIKTGKLLKAEINHGDTAEFSNTTYSPGTEGIFHGSTIIFEGGDPIAGGFGKDVALDQNLIAAEFSSYKARIPQQTAKT